MTSDEEMAARLALAQRLKTFLDQPGLKPGAYNDPEFLEMEKIASDVLGGYAHYVAVRRRRTKKDDKRTRAVVRTVVEKFLADVDPADIHRQCGTVTYALLQMLEASGVWSFAVRGSLRVEFDAPVGLEAMTLWAHSTNPHGMAGHVWLVAPPFQVVDVTAKLQGWQKGEETFIEPKILLVNAKEIQPVPSLHAADGERDLVAPMNHPRYMHLWSWLKPLTTQLGRTKLIYQPYGINAPPKDQSLENVSLKVGGKTLREFYDDEIRPLLASAA